MSNYTLVSDIMKWRHIFFSQIGENSNAWKKSQKKGDIPEPVPQTTSKANFLGGINFDIVDKHALKVGTTVRYP